MRSPMLHSRRGFTLIELAIVLAVAGLLFAGLYNLISGGNQTMRDNEAATQQTQLLAAVKSFLASSYGSSNTGYMTTNTVTAAHGGCNSGNCAVGAKITLQLPTSCSPVTFNPAEADPNLQHICDFLPSGFTSATINSYGQTYLVQILRDSVTPAGTAPASYSFMALTTGGTQIPDSSGGRIASLIGGDGGFVYSATNICGAPTNHFACGAYGAWSVDVNTAYGFAYPATGGYIASRTYVSATQNSNYPWLARVPMSGDATYQYNTMQTGLYMGSASGSAPYASIYLAPFSASTNGGAINMEGGTINMQGGTILGTGTSNVALTGDGTTANSMFTAYNNATCTMTSPNTPATCPYAMQTTTMNVVNLLQANALYAGTFIYSASDRRLKKEIEPLPDELPNIMRLNPVSFIFKSNDKASLGFIAQDVEKVYPRLVVPGANGMKSLNYDGLIAPLVSSIQELKKENDVLRRQIRDQEARQDKLQQELESRPAK